MSFVVRGSILPKEERRDFWLTKQSKISVGYRRVLKKFKKSFLKFLNNTHCAEVTFSNNIIFVKLIQKYFKLLSFLFFKLFWRDGRFSGGIFFSEVKSYVYGSFFIRDLYFELLSRLILKNGKFKSITNYKLIKFLKLRVILRKKTINFVKNLRKKFSIFDKLEKKNIKRKNLRLYYNSLNFLRKIRKTKKVWKLYTEKRSRVINLQNKFVRKAEYNFRKFHLIKNIPDYYLKFKKSKELAKFYKKNKKVPWWSLCRKSERTVYEKYKKRFLDICKHIIKKVKLVNIIGKYPFKEKIYKKIFKKKFANTIKSNMLFMFRPVRVSNFRIIRFFRSRRERKKFLRISRTILNRFFFRYILKHSRKLYKKRILRLTKAVKFRFIRPKFSIRGRSINEDFNLYFLRHYFCRGLRGRKFGFFRKYIACNINSRVLENCFVSHMNRLCDMTRTKFAAESVNYTDNFNFMKTKLLIND